MTMHPEVMPAAQQAVLRRLGPVVTAREFYLGGGTAVAIQIGHRRSVDLDWFTAAEIAEPLGLAAMLQRDGIGLTVEATGVGTLHAEAERVRVSFFEYRYVMLRPPVAWSEYQCQLASLEDLVCMKLSAIASRGAKKDFIDLYALGQTHLDFARMLALYQEKFRTRDLGHVIFSLTYFDDAEPEDMPEMCWDIDWDRVKRTIEGWVVDYSREGEGK